MSFKLECALEEISDSVLAFLVDKVFALREVAFAEFGLIDRFALRDHHFLTLNSYGHIFLGI